MNTSRQLMEPVASTALDSKPGTASVSLREVLDRQTPGRMPTSVGVQIILAAGEVLARAHERGSGLHGNLDPNCVDVDHLGAVRVRGFGEGIGSRRLSPYQAPELRRGEVADDLADVYSLAALLYEVITGYSSLQAAAREPCLGAEPVPRPSRLTSNVGAEFDVLMLRALALDPSDRPASVRALLNELRLMLRSMEIEATQAGLKAYVDEQLPWLAVRASGRIATPPPRPATPGPVLSMPAPPPSDPGQMPALVFGPNGLPVPPEGSALPQAAELGVAQVSGGSRRAVAADSRVSRRDFDAGVAPLSGRSRRAPDPVFVPVESAVDPISRPRLRASGSFRKT
ncbi:MAG: hypothetical protein ACT4TC_14980, partial [Myxococcaceae bacterium]